MDKQEKAEKERKQGLGGNRKVANLNPEELENRRKYHKEYQRKYRESKRVLPKRKKKEPKRKVASGIVYFIKPHGIDVIKVGMTIGSLGDRLVSMQANNWCKLEVIHTIYSEDVRMEEREIQKRLEPRHIRGEWFAMERDELSEWIR